MTTPVTLPALLSLVQSWGRAPAAGAGLGEDAETLVSLSVASFRAVVLEAIGRQRGGAVGQTEPVPRDGAVLSPPGGSEEAPSGASALSSLPPHPPGTPDPEAEVIAREAQRVGIDPDMLTALRRVENGGAGREFGVLTVPAPGLEEQARVAANTIRKNAARFARQGGEAIDPATGRYTEAFLRFFSARYAPLGAGNDPNGLNRFHAANLIALYRRVSQERS